MIDVFIGLAILSLCFWLLDSYVFKSEPIKTVARAVAVIILVVWLLQLFGLYTIPLRLHQ